MPFDAERWPNAVTIGWLIAERRRCRQWLLRFMQNDQPKFLTKAELRGAAMQELNVSKNSFDFAWIDAIETTGRRDWYETLRRRLCTKS